jgi:hypothetical protein
VIDTRPLWVRALSKRRRFVMPRAAFPQVLTGSRRLSDHEFVDLVRALVGLHPLHAIGGARDGDRRYDQRYQRIGR